VTSAFEKPKLINHLNGNGAMDQKSLKQLREKYAELCVKYQQTVGKLQRQSIEHMGTNRLGLWAMQTQAAGVAVVEDGKILLVNTAWLDLAEPNGRKQAFSMLSPSGQPCYENLDALAVAQAKRPDKGNDRLLFQREDQAQMIEVHLESVDRLGATPLTIVMAVDVTDRVRTEQELAQARVALEHQGRMRAMGELASGVAHDLNNLLGSLTLRVALLKKADPALIAAQEKNIGAMERLLKDAASRVRCLQDFGRRPGGRQIGPIQLDAVIREAIEMVRAQVEEKTSFAGVPVRIQTSLGSPSYVTGPSTAELRHMFINLLLNARDAMPKGGTIHISVDWTQDTIVVAVTDEGTGIQADHLDRIFEPFFSTKGALGTGLGLSTAHALMNELGGRITATNREEGGAVFTLVFPKSGADPINESGERMSPLPPRASSKAGTGHRILVIDDDVEHLQTTKAVIELEEQEVDTAASGREALMRIQAGGQYDLVLCDAGMPELNGWQVAEAIKGMAPSMRVYLLTGWGEQIAEDEPRRSLIAGVLSKPVNLKRIRSILAPSKADGGSENGAPGGE
jgi:signal transduction histidine kinase/ActR/RegA family two-component response regulator